MFELNFQISLSVQPHFTYRLGPGPYQNDFYSKTLLKLGMRRFRSYSGGADISVVESQAPMLCQRHCRATAFKSIRKDTGILRRERAALIWKSWYALWRRCHLHYNLKMNRISTLGIREKGIHRDGVGLPTIPKERGGEKEELTFIFAQVPIGF